MEFFFIVFIFSGIIKAFAIYYHINSPVDITLLSAFILIVYFIIHSRFKLKISKVYFIVFCSFIIFYLWICISLSYSYSNNYSYIKAFYFLTNILAFCLPLLCKSLNIRLLIRLFIYFTLFFSIVFLFIFSKEYKGDSSIQTKEFNDIVGLALILGELLGAAILIVYTSNSKVVQAKSSQFLLILVLFILLILMGARGPLIFTILLLIVYYILKLKQIRVKLSIGYVTALILILAIILIPILFTNLKPMIERAVFRTSLLIQGLFGEGGYGDSVTTRFHLLEITQKHLFGNIEKLFFGYGIGSFSIVTIGIDDRGYPHNFIYEILFELGLIGLILFSLFFMTYFLSKNKKSIITNFVVIYFILNMLKSSSLVDLRFVFGIMAVSLLYYGTNEQQTELKKNIIH
jgi:O-antigen ligase